MGRYTQLTAGRLQTGSDMVSTLKPTMLMGPRMNSWSQVQSMPTPSPVSEGGALDAFVGVYAGNMPLSSMPSTATTPPLADTPDVMDIISRGMYRAEEYKPLKKFVEDGRHHGKLEYDINAEGIFRIAFSDYAQQEFEVMPEALAMSKLLSRGMYMKTLVRNQRLEKEGEAVQVPKDVPSSKSEAEINEELAMEYLSVHGEMISAHRSYPEHVAMLKTLMADGGRWGAEARRFDHALTRLENRVKVYEELEREYRRTGDPGTWEQMRILMFGEIANRRKWLDSSPYHRMVVSHAKAEKRARKDTELLRGVLASLEMISYPPRTQEAKRRRGPSAISFIITTRRPEDLRVHMDDDFAGTLPADIAVVKVIAATPAHATRVKDTLVEAGIALVSNVDSVDVDTGALMAKDLEVILPSGHRMPVHVRVESLDTEVGAFPVLSVEPVSHVKIGRKDGTSVELTMNVQEIGAFQLWRYVTSDGRTASELAVSGGRMARHFTDPAFAHFGLVERLESMAREFKGIN